MAASKVIARSFSSSSVTQQLIKAPIQVFGLEGRYASALYSAASKQKSLDTVEKDLLKVQGLMKSDKKFGEFICDPSIKRKLKVEALKKICEKISLNSASSNIIALMAENGRLGKLNQVINTFKLLTAATRGEVICEVVTAKPLDNDLRSQLESALKAFTKKGETILLNAKVDPAILGGMVISIGDKYVDMSVASKLKKYTDIIKTAV